MKKSELVEIIRVAVRKELKSTIPVMLKEYIGSAGVLNPTEDIVEVARNKISVSRKKQPKKPQKHYTNNLAINKILNETVGGIPQEGNMVSGGPQQVNEFTDHTGNGVDINKLPDHVSNALTRDYSDVMKLVDAKRGGGS
jgi:hypothetical protein